MKLEGLAAEQWVAETTEKDEFGPRASIANRWRKKTRVPEGAECNAPLHSTGVLPMNIAATAARMSAAAKKRFDTVWHMTFGVDPGAADPAGPRLRLSVEHAKILEGHGLASRKLAQNPDGTTKKTGAWCEAFTCFEDKPAPGYTVPGRQRVIMWTKSMNAYLKNRYVPEVPLEHVSAYLAAALNECGGTRDMKIGFCQIEIPSGARHKFRFMTDDGEIWEFTRLPMGHRCSPELSQLLLSAVAGVSAVVKPAYAAKGVKIDVWIDNVRAHGSTKATTDYFTWLDRQAAQCAVTWKVEDSCVGPKYEFIGVVFDHSAHTVNVKPKMLEKLKQTSAVRERATIADMESQVGRLLHISAVQGTNPAPYYFFLKALRRRLSLVNRGLAGRGDIANLPPSAQTELDEWVRACLTAKPRVVRAAQPTSARYVLFSDASGKGWGAVLVDIFTARIRVAGGVWGADASGNISPAEVRALTCGILAFREHLAGAKVLALVDNTSAIVAATKGHSKSWEMNAEVEKLWHSLSAQQGALDVQYLPSRFNLSDGPSRGTGVTQPWRITDIVHRRLAMG